MKRGENQAEMTKKSKLHFSLVEHFRRSWNPEWRRGVVEGRRKNFAERHPGARVRLGKTTVFFRGFSMGWGWNWGLAMEGNWVRLVLSFVKCWFWFWFELGSLGKRRDSEGGMGNSEPVFCSPVLKHGLRSWLQVRGRWKRRNQKKIRNESEWGGQSQC